MTRPATPGKPGVRYIIRGGAVMTMDPGMLNKGEFAKADVLVEGNKIMAVGPNLPVAGATQIDATGRIVMPGFGGTHHHQFETALRSFLADGVLINDQSGSASGTETRDGRSIPASSGMRNFCFRATVSRLKVLRSLIGR